MAPPDFDKICSTLDKLSLDALTLMEEHIKLKLNVENTMCSGEASLAKTRYIMGQNSVTALQLPTENSADFEAPIKVNLDENELGTKTFDVELQKVTDENNVQDPLKWFGFLVPHSLHYAQNMFRQAIQWNVQAANVQVKLNDTLNTIGQLKLLKSDIKSGI